MPDPKTTPPADWCCQDGDDAGPGDDNYADGADDGADA